MLFLSLQSLPFRVFKILNMTVLVQFNKCTLTAEMTNLDDTHTSQG